MLGSVCKQKSCQLKVSNRFVQGSASPDRWAGGVAWVAQTVLGLALSLLPLSFLYGWFWLYLNLKLRLQTDANQVGVEKLSICEMHSSFGCRPAFGLCSDDLAPECAGLLPPMSSFMVKGWTRSFCGLTVLLCAYESDEFFSKMPADVKRFLD